MVVSGNSCHLVMIGTGNGCHMVVEVIGNDCPGSGWLLTVWTRTRSRACGLYHLMTMTGHIDQQFPENKLFKIKLQRWKNGKKYQKIVFQFLAKWSKIVMGKWEFCWGNEAICWGNEAICWGDEAICWGNEANLMGKWSKMMGKWSKIWWGDAP